MSLPAESDINGLEYTLYGEPFFQVALSGVDTNGLEYTLYGEPFLAISAGGGVTPPTPVYNASQFMIMF